MLLGYHVLQTNVFIFYLIKEQTYREMIAGAQYSTDGTVRTKQYDPLPHTWLRAL